jgi:diguanylate cyclase (GGDEF)-like protein
VDPMRLSAPDLWQAGGYPDSVLYEPLLRGSEPVGMLVVGWQEVLSISGSRVTGIGLLTHEAALLLTRADQFARLAGMATTDALTGLPNRRAWDERIAHAATSHDQLTVAILDIDNFKRFNDSHGHVAGDALLRETADAWSEHVRDGDLLARLGGEEFGLLLFGCDINDAAEVVERLRDSVTHGQTCSAGLAQRRADETVHAAIERSDVALYAAKQGGRDHARLAV